MLCKSIHLQVSRGKKLENQLAQYCFQSTVKYVDINVENSKSVPEKHKILLWSLCMFPAVVPSHTPTSVLAHFTGFDRLWDWPNLIDLAQMDGPLGRGTHIDWGLTWNEWVQHCNNSENHETSLSIVQNPASSLKKTGWLRTGFPAHELW